MMNHTSQPSPSPKKSRSQAGNIFFMLFASVALVGAFTVGAGNVVKGLVTSMSDVTRKTVAEEKMMSAARLSIMSATAASAGDCDGDKWVEPIPYLDAGTKPHPVGGGYVPENIGLSVVASSAADSDKIPRDPWGTPYGYCVWDGGSIRKVDNNPGCGGNTALRLNGSPHPEHTVVAIISAGKDRKFSASCVDYVDANADNNPDTPLVAKGVNSDDIILEYTYEDASGLSGDDLWKISDINPDVATIDKNIDVTGGAIFEEGALNLLSQGLILPGDADTGPCDAASDRQLRINHSVSPPVLQICDFTGSGDWAAVTMGGLGAGGTGKAPAAGLVAHWGLDDQFGSMAADSGPNNIRMEFASVPYNPDWIPTGKIGGAAGFDASEPNSMQADTIPYKTALDLTSFTLSLWIKPENSGSDQYLLQKASSPTDQNYYFYINNTDLVCGYTSGGTNYKVTAPSSVVWSAWQHVSCTFDTTSKALKIYTNSIERISAVQAAAVPTHNVFAPVIGIESIGLNKGYNGVLDEVRIYNRALSPVEITDTYADLTYIPPAVYTAGPMKEMSSPSCTSAGAGPARKVTETDNMNYYRKALTDGGYIYSSGSDSGIHALQIAKLDRIEYLANAENSGGSVTAITKDDKYIYLVNTSGELVAYTFDGTSFTEQGRTPVGMGTIDLWSDGTYIFATRGTGGIHAYKFDGTAFVNVATYITDMITRVWGDGKFLYTSGDNGLVILRFSGTGFTRVAAQNTPNVTYGSSGDGRYLYTITDSNKVAAFSFNGTTLTAIKDYEMLASAFTIWGDGSNTYIGYTDGNVTVLQFNGVDFQVINNFKTSSIVRHITGDGMYLYVSHDAKPMEVFAGFGCYDGASAGTSANVNIGRYSDKITAGSSGGCAIDEAGTLWCWGNDANGQLGNGPESTASLKYPSRVITKDQKAWKQVAMYASKCGIKVDGSAWCWGSDAAGQLGDDVALVDKDEPVPVTSIGTNIWTKMAAGYDFFCGIQNTGNLYCWGKGQLNILGNGSTTDQPTPVSPSEPGPWKDVAGGAQHTCGIKVDGSAWCWGRGTNGRLGRGEATSSNMQPVFEPGPWKSISAGQTSTCAVKMDGSAWCWGQSEDGSLGLGTITNTDLLKPVRVPDPGPWQSYQLSRSGSAGCGIKMDGSMWCWGRDINGEQANGPDDTSTKYVPTRVPDPGPWSAVQPHHNANCGMKLDGSAWCWGPGNQVGDNLNGSGLRHWPSRVAMYPKASTWQWNDAGTTTAPTGTSNIVLPVGGNSAIGRDGTFSDGIADGFRFDKPGGSVIRQANGPVSLRIETTGASTASQLSLRAASAATTRSIGIDYGQRALEFGSNLTDPTVWMNGIIPHLAIYDSGYVGIGITSGNPPAARLEIKGGLQVGMDTGVCFPARKGTLRFVGGVTAFEFCDGSAWTPF